MVADARERVGLHNSALSPGLIGEDRPRQARGGVPTRYVVGVGTTLEFLAGGNIIGKKGGRRSAEEILVKAHAAIMPLPDLR